MGSGMLGPSYLLGTADYFQYRSHSSSWAHEIVDCAGSTATYGQRTARPTWRGPWTVVFARLGSQQEIIKTLRILLPLDTGDAVESAASRKNG
jgi:hypothetical protein